MTDVLQRARRRWLIAIAIRLVVWSGLLVATVWLSDASLGVLGLGSRGMAGAGVEPWAWLLPLLGLLASIMVIVAVHGLRRGEASEERLLATGDRYLGLDLKLQTAVEVARNPNNTDIEHALLFDASPDAARLRARDLMPLRVPRWWIAAPLLAVLAGGLDAWSPRWSEHVPAQARIAGVDGARVTDQIARTAELLAVHDEASDPYVRALGMALLDLAERIESGTTTLQAAMRDLDDLVSRAASAVGAPAVTRRPGEEHGLNGTQGAGGAPDEAEVVGEDAPSSLTLTGGVRQPPSSDASNPEEETVTALTELLAFLEARPTPDPSEPETASSDPSASLLDDGLGYGDEELDPMLAEELMELLRQRGANVGTPVGTSQDATDREGDAAGFGIRSLDEGAAPIEAEEDLAFDDLVLPWSETADGARTTVMAVPTAEGVQASSSGVPSVPERGAPEVAAPRESVLNAYRLVVSRYFNPDFQIDAHETR